MYGSIVCLCVCAPHAVLAGAEEGIGAPGTEVILVVNHRVDAGNRAWVLLQEHQVLLSLLLSL